MSRCPARLDDILAGAVPVPGPGAARSASCPAWRSAAPMRPTSCAARKRSLPASAAVCRRPPSRLHARHPFEMGRGRATASSPASRTWLTGELFSRAVEAVDPAPFARRKRRAARLPDNPVFRRRLRRGAGARRRHRLRAVPHPRRDAAAGPQADERRRRAVRPADRRRDRLGAPPLRRRRPTRSSWSPPARSARSIAAALELAGCAVLAGRRRRGGARRPARGGEAPRLDGDADGLRHETAPFPKLRRGLVAILRGLQPGRGAGHRRALSSRPASRRSRCRSTRPTRSARSRALLAVAAASRRWSAPARC